MKLPWNTYNFTHRCHAQSTSFHALFTKNWLDYDKFLSVHSSENKIKVHVTCERCFPFYTSSFMEPTLFHQRSCLQRTQLSRVGPGHQSSMSVLRHWFPGPHSQTMEFGIHVSLENICRTSSRRRCKYKCSLQSTFQNAFELSQGAISSIKISE